MFMLKAGAAPAVVSALKHSNAYCRAAAASVAAGGSWTFDNETTGNAMSVICAKTEALKALREAGLVPALVEVVRAGRSGSGLGPATGVFRNIKVQMVEAGEVITLPNSEPALHACNALSLLTRTRATRDLGKSAILFRLEVSEEVAKTRGAAAALVGCLRQFEGLLQEPPMQLITNAMMTLAGHGGSSHTARQRAFCKELLDAGLPDLLPSLIRPGQIGISLLVLDTLPGIFLSVDSYYFPPTTLPPLAAALAKYIEEGPDDLGDLQTLRNKASYCLGMAMFRLHDKELRFMRLSTRCIKRVADVMGTGDERDAVEAFGIIWEQAKADRPVEVMKAALSSEAFVPGLLRVARVEHMAGEAEFQCMVMLAPMVVAACGEGHFSKAVDAGLLKVFMYYLAMPQHQKFALIMCLKLLVVPGIKEKLWEAGFARNVIRSVHSVVDLAQWLCREADAQVPGLAGEFVEAGLLEKLEKAKRKMVGQPAKQRALEDLIEVLASLDGSGSPGAGDRSPGSPGTGRVISKEELEEMHNVFAKVRLRFDYVLALALSASRGTYRGIYRGIYTPGYLRRYPGIYTPVYTRVYPYVYRGMSIYIYALYKCPHVPRWIPFPLLTVAFSYCSP